MAEKINILGRMDTYDQDHCWQYDIRLNNFDIDIKESGLSIHDVPNIRVSDFDFKIIEDVKERKNLVKFINKHEWLGNISQYTTHWFGAYYNGILAGVILMNMPNSFSKIVGDDTKKLERLVSRGACISWSPKNLASKFLMWSIKYMVKNTRYRVFTAYSDPTAKELGTIYQACNWKYIGQTSGATKQYINPYTGGLVSDRAFRTRSFYKKYAQDLGIKWDSLWNSDQKMNWSIIPDDVEEQLRLMSKNIQKTAESYSFPKKHKYVYILGKDKREHKILIKLFGENTKEYNYPKERGK